MNQSVLAEFRQHLAPSGIEITLHTIIKQNYYYCAFGTGT
jgi:hypothetical protein